MSKAFCKAVSLCIPLPVLFFQLKIAIIIDRQERSGYIVTIQLTNGTFYPFYPLY